jgi:hypothetical protein
MMTAPSKPGVWSTLRSMFRCALVIVVVAAVGLGVLAKSLWSQADQLLRTELERQISERIPGWDLTFASAKANLDGTVRVVDVLLRDRNGESIVEIPEIALEIDTEILFRHQKVLIHAVRVHDPLVRIHCNSSGHWNIDLPKPRPSGNAPPDVSVRNASVLVQLDASARWPAAEFRVGGMTVSASPESRHGYALTAKANLEHVGRVEVTGKADFANGVWRTAGRCDRVNLEGLLKSLVGISPAARGRVADRRGRKKCAAPETDSAGIARRRYARESGNGSGESVGGRAAFRAGAAGGHERRVLRRRGRTRIHSAVLGDGPDSRWSADEPRASAAIVRTEGPRLRRQ